MAPDHYPDSEYQVHRHQFTRILNYVSLNLSNVISEQTNKDMFIN